ncbi:Por secretion system C-terminal sorting domain-containing protein, partial [Reichenbachiella faecimaris]
QEITITADATGLNGGEYSADIVIESNDPENPTLTIPYTLTVTGSPNMEVNTSELDFGDVFVGREVSLLLQITNTGTETLEVSNLIINDANYSTDENSFSVAPGESSMIEIFYEPQSEGSHSAILNIESNDPNQETLTVELSASGVVPPEIVVQTTVIETVILPGDYKAKYLTFSNVGQADLEWTATLDFLSDDTSWLYLFEQTGSLSPGSDKSIGIGIEARYLINGFYHASILIYSNDPSNPLEVINLELEVTNQNILRLGYEQVEVEASVTNVTIPIETNQYDVQVSSVSNWIAYENHQDEVIVSFTINSSTSSRNASIEVTAGEASATCTIIQKANTVLDVSPENSSNLNLFPNPNYGELNISSTEIASLELMDVSGKSYELDYVKDAEVIRVNLTQLNNGIYYVKIAMNDGTVEIKKVILQK